MGSTGDADGTPETTERLLDESRELLRDLGERLGGEEGSVVVQPDDEGDESPEEG